MELTGLSNKKNNPMAKKIEAFEMEAYNVKDWEMLEKETLSLIECKQNSAGNFQFIDLKKPAEIIAKEAQKNGKTVLFYKAKIYYEGGGFFEYDLSFNKERTKDYKEGVLLDTMSLKFGIEEKLSRIHKFIFGDLYNKED